MESTSLRVGSATRWREEFAGRAVLVLLWPLQAIMALPSFLFLAALAAMLFRHPDVSFYEIDRVAFGLLVFAVVGKAIVLRQRILRIERGRGPSSEAHLSFAQYFLCQPLPISRFNFLLPSSPT